MALNFPPGHVPHHVDELEAFNGPAQLSTASTELGQPEEVRQLTPKGGRGLPRFSFPNTTASEISIPTRCSGSRLEKALFIARRCRVGFLKQLDIFYRIHIASSIVR